MEPILRQMHLQLQLLRGSMLEGFFKVEKTFLFSKRTRIPNYFCNSRLYIGLNPGDIFKALILYN
jgi:hypothetical protein